MKLATKLIIAIAIIYNGLMGYFVTLTEQPWVVLSFLCVDFFLIFYYLWILTRENMGILKFAKEHRELINKAREELKSSNP